MHEHCGEGLPSTQHCINAPKNLLRRAAPCGVALQRVLEQGDYQRVMPPWHSTNDLIHRLQLQPRPLAGAYLVRKAAERPHVARGGGGFEVQALRR